MSCKDSFLSLLLMINMDLRILSKRILIFVVLFASIGFFAYVIYNNMGVKTKASGSGIVTLSLSNNTVGIIEKGAVFAIGITMTANNSNKISALDLVFENPQDALDFILPDATFPLENPTVKSFDETVRLQYSTRPDGSRKLDRLVMVAKRANSSLKGTATVRLRFKTRTTMSTAFSNTTLRINTGSSMIFGPNINTNIFSLTPINANIIIPIRNITPTLTTTPPTPTATRVPTSPPTPTPESLPDLTIDPIVTSSQGSSNYTISVKVRNNGQSLARNFYLHGYVDPVDYPPTIRTPDRFSTYFGVALNPGGTFTYSKTVSLTEGQHLIYVWVDKFNTVRENNENNNTRECQATVVNGIISCGVPTPTVTRVPTTPPTPTVTRVPTTPPTPTVTRVPTTPPTPTVTRVPTTPPTPTVTRVPTTPPTPTVTRVPTATPYNFPTATPIPTGSPTKANLLFKVRMPDIPTSIGSVSNVRIQVSGNSSIRAMTSLQRITGTDTFKTLTPVELDVVGGIQYTVLIKQLHTIRRAFTVTLHVGQTIDCAKNVPDNECGSLKDSHLSPLYGGDSDGFNDGTNGTIPSGSYNKIDVADLQKIVVGYMVVPMPSEPNADFNLDGKIDIFDLGILGKNFGRVGN